MNKNDYQFIIQPVKQHIHQSKTSIAQPTISKSQLPSSHLTHHFPQSGPSSLTILESPPQLPDKNVKPAVHHYENFAPINGNLSIYENLIPAPSRPSCNNNNNNNSIANNTSLPRPKKHQYQHQPYERTIDNKLDVSNDDLLEAIEQLSMLSKPRHSGGFAAAATAITAMTSPQEQQQSVTPKRINSERDNAKSNEAKADKERRELEEEDRRKYVDFLHNEKQHILGNMDGFKRSVADIETQEEEINREVIDYLQCLCFFSWGAELIFSRGLFGIFICLIYAVDAVIFSQILTA